MRFPLSQPTLGPLEHNYVRDAMNSGWISGRGEYVARFESSLRAVTGRRFAIATASGTSALEVLLQALRIGPDDEVIVPALTFAAPVAAVANSGARPVLCDIAEEHWTMDVDMARRLLNSRTKAIVAVSIMGHPCQFRELEDLGVTVIEDAAEAHGSAVGDQSSGSFGLASVFSFHASKTITSGEGGAILTDDHRIADKCRSIANHGMTSSAPYLHYDFGRNAKLNNLSAAIGLGQVERWNELTAAREKVSQRYSSYLHRIDGVSMRPVAPWAKHSCWLACFSTTDIRSVVIQARTVGIDARQIWPSISSLPLYANSVVERCVVAEEVASRAAWLPTWSHMQDEDIFNIVRAVWPDEYF